MSLGRLYFGEEVTDCWSDILSTSVEVEYMRGDERQGDLVDGDWFFSIVEGEVGVLQNLILFS